MSNQFLLVLTGTITPAAGTTVARADPALRRADYFNAFNYWLAHPDPRLRRILFVENSGADLTDFHAAAAKSGKEVEIISIPPNPPPPEMHYGYSELQMLDRALEQSQLRRLTTHMIKATGRLVFPALPKLLDKLPANFLFAADARAPLPFRPSDGPLLAGARRKAKRSFIATQLFLVAHDFDDATLRKSYQDLAKSRHYPYFVEHVFFEKLAHLKGQKDILFRFPVNCEPVGFAGHATKEYNSPSRFLLTKARAICRVIAPDFWF